MLAAGSLLGLLLGRPVSSLPCLPAAPRPPPPRRCPVHTFQTCAGGGALATWPLCDWLLEEKMTPRALDSDADLRPTGPGGGRAWWLVGTFEEHCSEQIHSMTPEHFRDSLWGIGVGFRSWIPDTPESSVAETLL